MPPISHPFEVDADLLQRDFSPCNDTGKLQEAVRDLQRIAVPLQADTSKQENDLKIREERVGTREKSLETRERILADQKTLYFAEGSCGPEWILAEHDYPIKRFQSSLPRRSTFLSYIS